MPKKEPTYNEAVHQNFRELLKVVDLIDVKNIDKLEGEELRDFCKWCSEVYNNKFFAVIIQNFIFKQVMLTADEGTNAEQFWGGKMMCWGIKTVDDFFKLYALRWENEFNPVQEKFDPRAAFSKAKIG